MKLELDLNNINDEDSYLKALAETKKFFNLACKKYEVIKEEKLNLKYESLKKEPIRTIEKTKLYAIDREKIQGIFYHGILEMGFDGHGVYCEDLEDYTFENDVFLLRPDGVFENSDCSCGLADLEAELEFKNKYKEEFTLGFHDVDCLGCNDRIVNFWYKPTNLKITWYKYPLRDSYSNQEITAEYMGYVMKKCKESFKKK